MYIKKITSVLVLITLSTNFLNYNTPISNANNTKTQFDFDDSKKNLNKKTRISNDSKGKYVEGEVIIKYKENKKQSFNNKITKLQKDGLKIKTQRKSKGILNIKSVNKKTKDLIQELKTDKDIEYIQPNYIYNLQSLDSFNDTYKDNLWGLYNYGQDIGFQTGNPGADISWDDAINIFTGSTNVSNTGVIVAVLDTGVAYNHPDLINNMWDGSSCLDYEGNYLGGCIYGYDFDDYDKDPLLNNEAHGTHVAGTIAASLNNGKGITGVNPNAKIMALKHENFTTSSIINSISFAKYNNAKIINASFGGYGFTDQALYDAIKDFQDNGGLFIAAAGNNTSNHDLGLNDRLFPAGFGVDNIVDGVTLTGLTNIISVAAIDNQDNLAYFSDYGNQSVHIGAPGVSIFSTVQGEPISIYSQNFSNYSAGNLYGFSTGGLNNHFGANYTINGVWGDMNYPFMTGSSSSYIEKQIDISSIKIPKLEFNIWCDAGKNTYLDYTDYMSLSFSTGADFIEVDRLDFWHSSLLNLSSINLHDGYYGKLEYDLSEYISNNLKIRFTWVSDNTQTNDLGCVIFGDSLKPFKIEGLDDGTQESYGFMNGTSMATPHVAGLASLAWSYRPDLNYINIKNSILNSGDNINSLSGKTITGKKINANNTLINLTPVTNIQNINLYTDNTKQTIINSQGRIDNPYIEWIDDTNPYTLSGYVLQVLNGSGNTVFTDTTKNKYYTGFTITNNGNYSFSIFKELLNSNTGGLLNTSEIYFDVSPIGNIAFLNGIWTNTGVNSISINTDKLATYDISGDIVQSLTGEISTGSTIDVELSTGDGEKNIILNLTDIYGNTSTATGNIILDTSSPEFNLNVLDGQSFTGSIFTLTGTTSDALSGIGSININGISVVGNLNNWSHLIGLEGGANNLFFDFFDNAGNKSNTGLVLYRSSMPYDIGAQTLGQGKMEINYNTDISSTGAIIYGTSSGNLDNYLEGYYGTGHYFTIDNLLGDTQYYYQVFGKDINGTGVTSEIRRFKTPKEITDYNQNIISTGAIYLSGSTFAGVELGTNSGTVTIYNNDGTNYVTLNLDGLNITSIGNNWNGIIQGPELIYSNPNINDPGYSLIGSVFQAGNPYSSLSLSGQTAEVSIDIGINYNGKNLKIYRSEDGINYIDIGTCIISNGKCNFNTNHFSLFTFGEPTDTTPNSYSFSSATNSELSSDIISQSIIISGINKETPISIDNGSYSINNGDYTNQNGIINNNDFVKIKLTSSANYSTNTIATLTIGGVSGSFIITTKNQPISSGGGGGGGGITKDFCPQGDNSPSYYDRSCGNNINSSSSKINNIENKNQKYITEFNYETQKKINSITEKIKKLIKSTSLKKDVNEKKIYIHTINTLKKQLGKYDSKMKKSIVYSIIKKLERQKNILRFN